MPQLRLHSPAFIPGYGSTLDIPPGTDITVGRGADNQVVIADSSVSLHHAVITRSEHGWQLKDLEHTNGIWVGVRRVPELALTTGQLFRIGGVALEFLHEPKCGAIQPQEAVTEPQAVSPSELGVTNPANDLPEISEPTQVNPPNWEPPFESAASTAPVAPQVAAQPTVRRKPSRAYRVLASTAALLVLGFGVTLGAVLALRWFTSVRNPAQPPEGALQPARENSKPESTRAPDTHELTLAQRAIDSLGQAYEIEVPGALVLRLPAGTFHQPDQLIVARASRAGANFCRATEAADVYEVVSLGNAIWAHAATVELTVDADRLAKSGVPAVAIGFRDPADREWQLLPTRYDAERRVATTQVWQPGQLGVFFVNAADQYLASDHFAIVSDSPFAANAHDRHARALDQLEASLDQYRKMGFRVPEGNLWVCRTEAALTRSQALLPLFASKDFGPKRSHGLARAVFANLMPAYLNSRSMQGREFWFGSMLDVLAARVSGVRPVTATPAFKRLKTPLIADDWPASPLFTNVIPQLLDKQVDLFRLWTDTTYVMMEADTKPNVESQSPLWPIDAALQQMTHKSLLDHYSAFIEQRLQAERGASSETIRQHDVCSSWHELPAEMRAGNVALDIPASYDSRFACVSVAVKPGTVRNLQLRLAKVSGGNAAVRLIRTAKAATEAAMALGDQPSALDFTQSEVVIISAVNGSMAQASSISVGLEDLSITASIAPADAALSYPAQEVTSALVLSDIRPDHKVLTVRWDFGDGSPGTSSESTANAAGQLRLEQTHAWPREGTYSLRAFVTEPGHPNQVLATVARVINIKPLQLEMAVSGTQVAQSELVLHLNTSGPVPQNAVYRVSFGDGSPLVLGASPEVKHQYGAAGDYLVIAELLAAADATHVLSASQLKIRVAAAESPAAGVDSTVQSASPEGTGGSAP